MARRALGGGTLLYAGEIATYNGPWVNPDDMRKLNGVLRYSEGNYENGFSLTGMAYRTNGIRPTRCRCAPSSRARSGSTARSIRTTAAMSSRFSLSGRYTQTDDAGAWRANAYAVRSTLNLFNNFTFFLSDQINGDQFHQLDDRTLVGANVSRTINWNAGGLPMETTFGFQSRYDDVKVALTNTVQRQFLSNIRTDLVKEGSAGVYAQHVTHWTDWFRTIVGLRGDFYRASDNSIFDPANSGKPSSGIVSPKFSVVFGPFARPNCLSARARASTPTTCAE